MRSKTQRIRRQERSHYRGLRKTHLQQVMLAVAINIRRLIACFDKAPKSTTRTSHFAVLAA